MNPTDFFKRLSELPPGVMELSPGPFILSLGESDPLAAKLIVWMEENLLPEDATYGDALDVLDMARWWLTFWQGLVLAEERIESEDIHPVDWAQHSQ